MFCWSGIHPEEVFLSSPAAKLLLRLTVKSILYKFDPIPEIAVPGIENT
jgi:hypothetical protein